MLEQVSSGSATWLQYGGSCRPEVVHAPRAETMSVLGVPVMTKKSFIATEKAIGHEWWDALEKSMKEATEEEKRNA